MLKPNQKVAIYMQGFLHSDFGKMGLGIIRYSENPIVGIIDSENAGSNINREYKIDRDIPIYNSFVRFCVNLKMICSRVTIAG